MLKTTQSQIINGGSWITQNGTEVQIASVYASLDSKGNRNENVSILNQNLYETNKETVESDIAAFREMASGLSNE